jgi:predicted dinucleotide-binding enzyme
MDIEIVGTGSVAESLGVGWTGAGHRVRFVSCRPEGSEVLGPVDLASRDGGEFAFGRLTR